MRDSLPGISPKSFTATHAKSPDFQEPALGFQRRFQPASKVSRQKVRQNREILPRNPKIPRRNAEIPRQFLEVSRQNQMKSHRGKAPYPYFPPHGRRLPAPPAAYLHRHIPPLAEKHPPLPGDYLAAAEEFPVLHGKQPAKTYGGTGRVRGECRQYLKELCPMNSRISEVGGIAPWGMGTK